MFKHLKLPRVEVMERLRHVDHQGIVDRYNESKRTGAADRFPIADLADAVCALRYVHDLLPAQIGDRTGLSKTQIGVLQHYAFVTNEVRELADFRRPEVDRLGTDDINVIYRLPLAVQPAAARNLLSDKRKRLEKKVRRARLRQKKS